MLGRPRTGILPHKMTGKIWEAIVQFTAQKHKFTKKLRFNYTTRECLPSSCTYHYACYWCLVTKSCLTLCDPMDHSLPGSSVHGISQARTLEWVVISFSRGSSQPRDQTHVSCISRYILYHWATWEAFYLLIIYYYSNDNANTITIFLHLFIIIRFPLYYGLTGLRKYSLLS